MTTPPVDRSAELAVHRKNTEWFIAWNPIDLVLIPKVRTKTGSGSVIEDGPPRPVQRMRLIPQSETTPPTIIDSGTGQERVISFVLLGTYDAQMDVGDHWTDDAGNYYEVINVNDYNGYEVKGLIEAHGNKR